MYECIERVSSSYNDKIYTLKKVKKEIEIMNRTREIDKNILIEREISNYVRDGGKKGMN